LSDISLSCSQVGPIAFKEKCEQGEDVFRKRRSLLFKKMQIISNGRPRKKLTKRELIGAARTFARGVPCRFCPRR